MARKTINKFEAFAMTAIFFGLAIVYYNLNSKDKERDLYTEQLGISLDLLEERVSKLEEQNIEPVFSTEDELRLE